MFLLFFTVLILKYEIVKLQLENFWPEAEVNDLYEKENTDRLPTPNFSSLLNCTGISCICLHHLHIFIFLLTVGSQT